MIETFMDRRTLITVVIALAVVAAGAWYWYENLRITPEEQALTEAVDLLAGSEITDEVSSAVDTSVKPVGETPDANPVERANPFTNVKTNPFE